MTDSITVTGVVGSDPRVHVTSQGLAITSFRLASTRRYFDRAKGAWEDGETNWYTVSGFRQLAHNTAASVRRGDRVVVQGRLRLRAWESGEKSGTAIEIEADSIGHDLAWGTTILTKVRRESATVMPTARPSPPRRRDGRASRRAPTRSMLDGTDAADDMERADGDVDAQIRDIDDPRARGRRVRGHPTAPTSAASTAETRLGRSPPPDTAVATAETRGAMARRLDITAGLALAGAVVLPVLAGCTAAPTTVATATSSTGEAAVASAEAAPATSAEPATLRSCAQASPRRTISRTSTA